MRNIHDTILWLESLRTGKRFPTVGFSADTDMATDGWVSLTSVEKYEIVVTKVTATEYYRGDKDPRGFLAVEIRVNAALCREDLKCPWFIRAQRCGPSAKGLSFQEFMKVSRPPINYYRDIFQSGAEAREVSRVSQKEFEEAGGKLVVL